MGIWERITTVVKANINDLISKAEDPEKMLNQIMEDMERDHIQVKTAVAQAIATEKQLGAKYRENAEQAEKWGKKAELAVNKGDDTLAREALSRKKTFDSTAAGFQSQWEAQKKNVEGLKARLGTLESKMSEARIKKDLLIARSRQATAEKSINQTMAKADPNRAFSAFERMEAKVLTKESEAAAYAELGSDSIEDKFRALESEGGVDDELAALKAKMNAR